MEDSNGHGQDLAGHRSYMERILMSLHAGHEDPPRESSNLLEEPSVVRGQPAAAFYTGTNTCENLSSQADRYSTEQHQLSITSGTSMWPDYCSDFSTLMEESLELQPMMMSYDLRSIDTNDITPSRSVTASCPASFSSFVDPLACNLIKAAGEQEHELSWIDFDDGLNSAMMMSQEVEAAASTHEPLPSDQMSSLVAASCDQNMLIGKKILRNSQPDFAASHGSHETVNTRRGTSSTKQLPGTPNSDQSLSSSVSDGSADWTTNSGSTIQRQQQKEQELQLVGCDAVDKTTSKADGGAGVEKGAAAAVDEEEEEEGEGEEDQNKTCKTKKQLHSPILRARKKGQMKRVKQPKRCIKTRTDVEIMDDNFKWRKYGQKAVKNSPYPRNYYRCSTQNCPVRKRVERCADDPGFVLTTYEGTHTHQSPAFARLPIGAYFGGFGPPFMDPLSQTAYIHSLGTSAASLLPLFAQRDLTCNPNYVGSLSSSMFREALNSYYSRIGTIPPPSIISASQQFGGGQLIDPLLVKLQHMEYNLRSETQNSVSGTQSEMQSPQTGPMIDFSTHPSSGSQPMLQDASPQVWEAVRATQGRIAEAAALQQFDDNKFIEPAKLWSSGQDFVGGRDGLLRPPTTTLFRSLQAGCRTDEGLLEDMIRPALPRYGLR
ncbi:unnamed protein product [Sphagnum troendelagicum]|uniref:WRKY domain-containing protein n=1 Tax=Sphagnum troendelagicum TaxID=128251 RepID=A0ABP0V5X8_9BRYO